MAHRLFDRVQEVSTSTGTGNFTVPGVAVFGCVAFDETDIQTGDTFPYVIEHESANEVEVGKGTWLGSNQFSRVRNGGLSLIDFSAGNKRVYIAPAAPTIDALSLQPPNGRLTLVTNTPVMTSDQTAKTAIFYTAYNGCRVPVYDGMYWRARALAADLQLSLDSTNHLFEHVYDVFVYDNAGALSIGAGPTWVKASTITVTIASPAVVTWTGHGLREGAPVIFTTSGALPTGITAGTTYYVARSPAANTFQISTTVANAAAGTHVNTSGSQSGTHTGTNNDTSRGTGAGTTELTRQDGLWVNANSITLTNGAGAGVSGIAAGKATYVGSFYCTANGQTGMAFIPAAAAGGTASILGLFNAYNRVPVFARSEDSTASWTYNSTTWRAANGNVNSRVSLLDGLAELLVICHRQVRTNDNSGISGLAGATKDATNVAPLVISIGSQTGAGATTGSSRVQHLPALGFHYWQATEAAGIGTTTYFGSDGNGNYDWLSVEAAM